MQQEKMQIQGGILRKKQYEKSLETLEKKQEALRKKEALVKSGEIHILEEYKKNLPKILEKKLNEIATELSKLEQVQGLTTIEINEILRPHNIRGTKAQYSTEQLYIVFEYYRKAIADINKKIKYPPTKENFCAFAGISTATYNSYMMTADEDKQEIMLMIDDYIRENMLTSAQLREIDNITTMFRGKTAHGLVEASAPIIIEHKSEVDTSKINQMINTIKSGKSLKTIELDKKDYKIKE